MANLSFTIKDIPEDLPLSFAMQHYHVELITQECENCGETNFYVCLDYYPEFTSKRYISLYEYDFGSYFDALYKFLVLIEKAVSMENDWRKEFLYES